MKVGLIDAEFKARAGDVLEKKTFLGLFNGI
jgi:hypothetical protein